MDAFPLTFDRLSIVFGLFLLIWGLRLVDGLLLRGKLNQQFAIQPRTHFRLLPFIIAPFLHKDFKHILSNTIPLLVLAYLVMVPNISAFWLSTPVIGVASGLGIWLFGKTGTAHLGASSLILGYFGYVLARGILFGNFWSILVALIVLVLGVVFYGLFGMIGQIIPGKKGISTTGHLFGFLGGILAAWLISLFVG